MKSLPFFITKTSDDEISDQLNKIIESLTIINSGKSIIITRNNKTIKIPYKSYHLKDILGTIADLYEANKYDNYNGFEYSYVKRHRAKVKNMFTQQEIDLFPLSG